MTSSKLVFDPTHGSSFADRTMVVSGGSRAIGLGAARRGANVVLLAKTAVEILSGYGGGPDPIIDIFVDK